MATTLAPPAPSRSANTLDNPAQHPLETPAAIPPAAAEKLRDVFGFDRVRPGQAEVISSLLAGRSAVALFPTGGGKSLCYQLPALLLDGVTLVVSPLIALMKDQIDFLASRGVPAARLDSSLTREENFRVFDDLAPAGPSSSTSRPSAWATSGS